MFNQLINLGNEIKNLRIENGMSQEDLSKKTGLDRAQISKIESGLISGVQYLTINKIYEALGYPLEPTSHSPKPFVKWAGGKTHLLDKIIKLVPKDFNTYYEPFVGGGALLFKLQPRKFVINDINKELIKAYKCFETNKGFNLLMEELLGHTKCHSEEYFYDVRSSLKNKEKKLSQYEIAARFIYLNKSCFNGLYRVNSNGFFNVPSGKKQKVCCFDHKNFQLIRNFFKETEHKVFNKSYEKVIESCKKGDFVYLDPPYDSWEDKKTFTSYSKRDFGKKDQYKLSECFKKLNNKGVFVMLSNHKTEYICELYKDFNIFPIETKRLINPNGAEKNIVEEVIITNYKI